MTPKDRRGEDPSYDFEGGCGFTDPRWDDDFYYLNTWIEKKKNGR